MPLHPASEEELVALVKRAYREGRQLRVRGAAHSIAHAICTDPHAALPNRASVHEPPRGAGISVMLDHYRGWRVRDEECKLVEVDAGMHLGRDPGGALGVAPLGTGGITHQTVSGFTATGSAEGPCSTRRP
jgi:FAD/FMN-containing dehydrogenase